MKKKVGLIYKQSKGYGGNEKLRVKILQIRGGKVKLEVMAGGPEGFIYSRTTHWFEKRYEPVIKNKYEQEKLKLKI